MWLEIIIIFTSNAPIKGQTCFVAGFPFKFHLRVQLLEWEQACLLMLMYLYNILLTSYQHCPRIAILCENLGPTIIIIGAYMYPCTQYMHAYQLYLYYQEPIINMGGAWYIILTRLLCELILVRGIDSCDHVTIM